MPAFLTYWRILIETAHQNQDAGYDLGSLIVDAATLRRRAHGWSTPPQTTPAGAVWDTGPLPEVDFRFPGSDISAMAFLGALAPDIMYYHRRYLYTQLTGARQGGLPPDKPGAKRPRQWSELFHLSHSGDLLIMFLEQIALVPSPAVRSQALAFALGYASHMAADLALGPWINKLASRLPRQRVPEARLYVALRLDEYLATSYFEHPRYSILRQPWGGYIEPLARDLNQPGIPAAQVLHLLALAAEVYGLDEDATATLPRDFLAALQDLRSFLAGRGHARWLTLRAAWRRESRDLVSKVLSSPQSDAETLALEKVLNYAFRLSERFCRGALNYYTALRNPQAEAGERSSRRAALVGDLRNWNLHTGYEIGNEENEPVLHNWTHFADLWEQTEQEQAQMRKYVLPTS